MRDAQLVRAVLERGNMTHAGLARALRYKSAKTVSRWLTGETRLNAEAADQLRIMYLAMEDRYGDDEDVRYMHLYAGVFLSPLFDPIKAFRDAYVQFGGLPRRKRIRVEWAYGNSRYYRRDLPEAEEAFQAALVLTTVEEADWELELEQNLLGVRLDRVKQLPVSSPKRLQVLSDALDLCQRVLASTPDSIAYVNALEVASQLELGELCDEYFQRLVQVSNGAYADPHYRPNRHSRSLAEAEEFAFLRTRPVYRRICGVAGDGFFTAPLRPIR